MRWEDERQSDNVEDKSQQMLTSAEIGTRIGLAGAGFALLKYGRAKWAFYIALALLILAFIGFSAFPNSGHHILKAIGVTPSQTIEQKAATKKRLGFVSVVLAQTEDVWTKIYKDEGKTYLPPALIFYRTAMRSACGAALNAIGPFYCPNDRTVYLDDDFFKKLSQDIGAPGEFASAYVIAHEVGHHIQNLDGTYAKIEKERLAADERTNNILSTKLELQADCYAGVWANYMRKKEIANQMDIEQALYAAHQIGDDNLQKQSEGYVIPDSFTHGTSEQRVHWFEQGLKTGDPQTCKIITESN